LGSAIVVATPSVPTYCQISSPLHISPSGLDQVALNSTRSCPGCSVTCRRLDRRRHFAADRRRHFAADRRRHSATLTGGGGTSRPDRRRHSAAWTGCCTSRRRRSESWPGPAAALVAWTGAAALCGLDRLQQRHCRPLALATGPTVRLSVLWDNRNGCSGPLSRPSADGSRLVDIATGIGNPCR
jgi:hypothetical protein